MILTHQQIVAKGFYNNTLNADILVADISMFQESKDERSLKLLYELIAKMKVYRKINEFFSIIASDWEIDVEKLQPLLDFFLDGKELSPDQVREFFEVEQQVQSFEEDLFKLGIDEPKWYFSYQIHAAVLGVPLEYLNNLEYTSNVDKQMAFEDFEQIVLEFTMSKISYEDMHGKLKGWYINVNRAA